MAEDDSAFLAYKKALARAIEARSYEQSLPDGHPNKGKAKAGIMLANIAVKAASDELRGAAGRAAVSPMPRSQQRRGRKTYADRDRAMLAKAKELSE